MKKSLTVTIIVVAILVVGGLVYWYSSMRGSPYPQPASNQPPAPAPITPAAVSPIVSPQPTGAPVVPAPAIVTYTDNGFSPKAVTIPKGGTVIFKNAASDAVRVASNPHPIHNGYPTTGGCVGSTFDSCSNIPPGGSWLFTFTYVGSWGYHNHLNPSEGGTVIVQ